MFHGQRLQLGDDLAMTSGVQIGVDAGFESGEPDLTETGALAVQPAVRLDIGVGAPAPRRQRGAQHAGGVVGIGHRRRGPIALLERHAVDHRADARQHIGVALSNDDVAENLTQVRHVRLQRATSTGRRILAVDRLEQRVDRHRMAGGGDQDSDDDPLLGTTQGERNPVNQDLQRAQDPVVHAANVLLDWARDVGNLHRPHRERPPSRNAQATARPEQVPPIAGHVLEDGDSTVELVARLAHELDADGPHAAVLGVKVLNAQKEADTTGVLATDDRSLIVTVGLRQQEAGDRTRRSDDDPPFRPSIVGVRRRVLDELETKLVNEEGDRLVVITDDQADERQVHCWTVPDHGSLTSPAHSSSASTCTRVASRRDPNGRPFKGSSSSRARQAALKASS